MTKFIERMKKTLFWFGLFSIAILNTTAQTDAPVFTRALDVQVFENEAELKNPWLGGLNYLQYSTIELNGDEFEDLFVFDRSCHKYLTYINDGIEGEVSYTYAPEYESLFPEGMRNWVLLRDYNCDGLKDVFSSRGGGIDLFKQVNEGGVISFVEVYENLIPAEFNFGNPFLAPAYNISVDLPHIGDIDNDGDIDILTFSDASTTVFYFINQASDFDRCDTMALRLGNRCYGYISESSENNNIFLGFDDCMENNVVDPKTFQSPISKAMSKDGLHVGGTLLSLDTNGDGRQELVIGDITNDSLIMLTNAASILGPDSMISQVSNFPASFSDSELINFHEFPGAYHEDFNNDGIRDLASSSFSSFNSIDDHSSWLYINSGEDDFPNFILQSTEWLQDETIEHGTEALPVIFDYNQDGLGDLLVGNRFTILDASTTTSSIRLYENIGTETQAAFELRDEDWLSLSELNLLHLYPSFGDMDGDGDQDMYLGESTGKLHYFENSAGPGNPVEFPEIIPTELSITDINGDDVDPGQDVITQIIDLDNDGLLDLVVGEFWGNLNFYKNVGTVNTPEFEFVEDTLGGFFVDSFFGIQGKCAPFIYERDGEWEAITGNDLGHLQRWGNITDNLDGNWLELDSLLGGIDDGDFSTPFLYDLNGDDQLDLVLGNERGGVTLFYGDFTSNISEIQAEKFSFNLYPNPTSGSVTISFSGDLPENYQLFSLEGKLVSQGRVKSKSLTLDCSHLVDGFYTVVLSGDNKTVSTEKFLLIK